MAQPSERTRLLVNEQKPPPYVFETNVTRERKNRLRRFQCCVCAILLCMILIGLVAILAYSIDQEVISDENTTDTSTINDLVSLSPSIILFSRQWPIPDKTVENKSIDDETFLEAAGQAENNLKEKDEIEKNVRSLNLRSPSYRHQKVVATSEMARNLSKLGYLEEYATRHIYRNNTNRKTDIRKICQNSYPFSQFYCEQKTLRCNAFQKFRTFNGTCNNLKHPDLYGVSYRPFRRALPPDYVDGISQPRVATDGSNLPSARTVSLIVHLPYNRSESKFTVMLAIWGQFLDHDITATALSQKNNGSTISCCQSTLFTSPECFPVILDNDDPFGEYNISCIEFVRSAPAPTCCLGPREQMNQVTSFIDGSVVYSSEEASAKVLRDMQNGTLKVYLTSEGRALLPQSDDLNDGCNRIEENKNGRYCFMAGDARANENLHLTTMHLIWVRQHNLLAKTLSHLNPQWNDERIFQESRRILTAQMQHITYNEFLPILLGENLMEKFDLYPRKAGYCTSYNDSIDPNIANNFATAAFRFAHSIIPSLMKFLASDNSSPDYIQLHKMLFNPFILYDNGSLDMTLRGALNTTTEASDSYFTEELKSHMFERQTERMKHPKTCGLDLVALNIQRGRDHGLPAYSYWREHCGFDRPKNFSDLDGIMEQEAFNNIQALYRNIDDVDLYTGILSEIPMPESILGPTITCLILDQFYRLKHGDRYWYENQGPHGFSPQQLGEIRKTSLANIICDNSDNLDGIQPKVMETSGNNNTFVPCSHIPKPNLDLWAEKLFVLKLEKNDGLEE